ncbi:hypothetical protein IWW36_004874, partial [Coemansia brasiliensis]
AAAKARMILNRPAGTFNEAGVVAVNVSEPPRAPWADCKPASAAQTAEDRAQASLIMSKLTSGMSKLQTSSTSDSSKQTHAQSIINTLLTGLQNSTVTKSTASATANKTVSVLNTQISGQYPLVIEDDYDSLDEDDQIGGSGANLAGMSAQPRHSQVYFDYSTMNRGRGRGNGRGRGRGRGRGNRGHGHTYHETETAGMYAAHNQSALPENRRGRGRGRGRGRSKRGGYEHDQ